MGDRTAVEMKADNERAMGATLGAIYSELWQELGRLHGKWREYVELFGTSPERVALLNSAAPMTTKILQDALWDDVLLHICRMTDRPKKSANKQILSVGTLAKYVDRPNAKSLVDKQVTACEASSQFARDHRDRRIAHNNYLLALQQGATPLAPDSREKVRHALADLVNALGVVAWEYLGEQPTRFDLYSPAGGAVGLLMVVRDGMETLRARQSRFESATATPEDFAASIRPI